jgi:hypothetical protein
MWEGTVLIEAFESSLHHLLAELERLDLLIAAQVVRAREVFAADEQFRGLYIAEEEVDALLEQPIGRPRWYDGGDGRADLNSRLDQIRERIELRKGESLRRGGDLRLAGIQELFQLDSFEVDCLLLCLAVELDLRYERLFAYLQDDVTRKRPSVDLVLNLLVAGSEAKVAARSRFLAGSRLLRHQLLYLCEDPSQPHPPLLAQFLKIDPRIVDYLLGSDDLDERIQPFALLNPAATDGEAVDGATLQRIRGFAASCREARPIVYLQGGYGAGREETARALCREEGAPLLVVLLDQLPGDERGWQGALALVQREATLQRGAVCWKGFDTLLGEQNGPQLRAFLRSLQDRPTLTFIAGEAPWEPAGLLPGAPFARVELPKPAVGERARLWKSALAPAASLVDDAEVADIAAKFRFSTGQIRDAAATAVHIACLRDAGNPQITAHDLYEACRRHSNAKLTILARKISPKYAWGDIVLPADRLEELRQICNHVKYRDRVYGAWGFDRKLSLGKGLSVLFAGPSGTGKTMAAEIIARELGLDLYKIDLSTVVSKYIGETEKNLSAIFAEAETSNAILFFDEADALFGKRSEVKDSHDRYANIETGYLLQRMEEYEGIVILATNFRKNMEEAFVRRLQFTIEFPFPDQRNRRKIWDGVWPREVPLDAGLDLDLLARRFEMSGGNIRNVALAAAFFAAEGNGPVEMRHVLQATRREYQKLGKVVDQFDFERPGQAPLPRPAQGDRERSDAR